MSDPQVEFFGFLFGARTSPPLQQFLLQNLGDSVCFSISQTPI